VRGTIRARVSHGRYGVAPSSRPRASAGGTTHEAGGGGWGGGGLKGDGVGDVVVGGRRSATLGPTAALGPPPLAPRVRVGASHWPHTERAQHPTAPAAGRSRFRKPGGGASGTLPTATWLKARGSAIQNARRRRIAVSRMLRSPREANASAGRWKECPWARWLAAKVHPTASSRSSAIVWPRLELSQKDRDSFFCARCT